MNKIPFVERGDQGGIDFYSRSRENTGYFLYGFFFLVVLFFFVLIQRLFHLTVVKGAYYESLSQDNRIREIVIEPKRGTIIDRKGFVLAENVPGDIESDSGGRIVSKRFYRESPAFAHIIGYRQSADKPDLEKDQCINKAKLGDKVGKKGVEKLFECAVRGKRGTKMIEVDARGKYVRTLTVIKPEDGALMQLSVDADLQKMAYEQMKDKKGVVVALKPQTGEVLSLVSTPSFDSQMFEESRSKDISAYVTNSDKPLFDRALEGKYPPGSVFKIAVAAGALEDKKIDKGTIVEDTGTIKAGDKSFGNWYFLEHGKTEGAVDIIKSLRRSNDIFYYKVGELLGPSRIKYWAEEFGYGDKTGIGLDETSGVIPFPFWKEDKLKEKWYLGDTYNMSIGQGYLLVNPLQVALSTAVVANNGIKCKPQILKVGTSLGSAGEIQTECNKLPISQQTLDLLKQGMTEACSSGGTGWPFFDFKVNGQPMKVACKTGTAESHAASGKPHAWFTVFAPAENPEIVMTVLVEESGQGSDIAAPIAKELLKSYFERLQ